MLNPRIYCCFVLVLSATSFMGCGKKGADSFEALAANLSVSCSNPNMVGTWRSIDDNSRADVLQFGSNCVGASSYCGSEFTYSSQFGSTDFVLNVVKTNGNAACPTLGQHTCTFAVSQVVVVPAGPMQAGSAEINCNGSRIYAGVTGP